MNPLSGKTAIVTGASCGIGLAIAQALAREGVRLGLLSRSKPDIGGEFVACDLAELEQVPTAMRQLVERLGEVDYLINNAGVFLETPVSEMKHRGPTLWRQVIQRAEALLALIRRRNRDNIFVIDRDWICA
jgi:3-oxoacyl-[acyl-carrier protein] reductase